MARAVEGQDRRLFIDDCFDVNGTDGAYPLASLVMYRGNLYGTTLEGGTDNIDGTVFELKHTTKGWTETILHSFGASGDGSQPYCALTLDTAGNLYGTTNVGGAYDRGTVFEVTPSGTETILWSFGNGTDGANPLAGVVRDAAGNLYGTTDYGGAYGYGTVYEVTSSIPVEDGYIWCTPDRCWTHSTLIIRAPQYGEVYPVML